MSRVIIETPEHFPFSTELEVYIGLVNRGDHLGNESLVALLNEARLRFMAFLGLTQFSTPNINFINADLAVSYRAEAKHGDRLLIEVAAQDYSKYGCDFVYRVTNTDDQRCIALAKTAMLTFDYQQGRLVEAPDELWQALDRTSGAQVDNEIR